MSDNARSLRPGELARATGLSTDTLRHYERIGVLSRPLRSQSGYRAYPAASVERVKLVQDALRLGFTLAELAEILQARDRGGAPCKRVLGLLEAKLDGLEVQIRDLMRLRKHMGEIVDDWRSRVGLGEAGARVHLLNSLTSKPVPSVTHGSLQIRRTQQ